MFPGVTVSADLGDFGYNQMVYTTLSNNRGQYISIGNTFGYPVTPMAFDIAAIQFLYGPNTTYHSGSDGYGLPDEKCSRQQTGNAFGIPAGPTPSFMTEKRTPRSICAPRRSSMGDPIAGGAISRVDGIFGGLTIANGVVIENAAGGSGNDTITGNSTDTTFLMAVRATILPCFLATGASYALQDLGNRIVVSGPDGSDTLFSIEHARSFADTTVHLNAAATFTGNWLSSAESR